jgi:hypothetical protein
VAQPVDGISQSECHATQWRSSSSTSAPVGSLAGTHFVISCDAFVPLLRSQRTTKSRDRFPALILSVPIGGHNQPETSKA